MVWLVLAACFVCPAVQMFDSWDHELQTGQDTEFVLFAVALCIGAAFVALRALIAIYEPVRSRSTESLSDCIIHPLGTFFGAAAAAFVSPSPPSILRI